MKTKSALVRFVPLTLGVVATVSAGAAAVYFLRRLIDEPLPQAKPVVQQVRLIRPPPPPPEVEKPPEPPKIEEEVELPEEPVETPPVDDLPPPGELLGLDAEGVAGADGFGLVARRGGRDLLASGSGNRFAWYANILKDDLLAFLAEHREVRSRAYDVQVRLWLNGDGSVERVDLASSTGDATLDRELRTLLANLTRVAEAPPSDLPQPVQLRIVSRL